MESAWNVVFPVVVSQSFYDNEEKMQELSDKVKQEAVEHPDGFANEWAEDCGTWNSLIHTTNILQNEGYKELLEPVFEACSNHIKYAGVKTEGKKILVHESWTNLVNPGQFQEYHEHSHCHFAGVMYFDVPEDSGHFIFRNPENRMFIPDYNEGINPDKISHLPRVGEVIIFPSWMLHAVGINRSDQPRISLAFNWSLVDE